MTLTLVVVCGAFLLSLFLTGRFRQFALDSALLDVPNERSSHSTATPRGGGVAIVVATVLGLLVLGATSHLPWREVSALSGAGMLIAALGFADDRRGLSARVRLLGHFVAAAWLVAWSGLAAPVVLIGSISLAGPMLQLVAVIAVVWLTNLTNFMDGIDGIAASETVTVCVGGWALVWAAGSDMTLWAPPMILMAATLGFLVWNWPPAKIFMGDAGSGFLGLCLAGFTLRAGTIAPSLLWAWLVLLGVFIVDATVTLFRRVAGGQTFYHAHRSHAYQHAAVYFGRHRTVTLIVCAINVCWLLPMAYLAARGVISGALAVTIAYTPLVILAWRLDAGVEVARL